MDTISFNRSYIAWNKWGFAPTLYACLDPVGFKTNALEIRDLIRVTPCTQFFLPDGADSFGIAPSAQVSLVRMAPGRKFATDISALTDFGNVGATSIQILGLLGYSRIAMVGVDARYSHIEKAVADKDGFILVDDDADHFCPGYGRGKRRLTPPDLTQILGQWPVVAKECARHGIAVRNASPGSALDCFPTTDFQDAIEWVLGA